MERIPPGRLVAGCVVAGLSAVAAAVFLRRIAVDSLRDLPAGEAAAYAAAFSMGGVFAIRSALEAPGRRGWGDAAAFALATVFAAGLTSDAITMLSCLIASGATIAFGSFGAPLSGVDATGRAAGGTANQDDIAAPPPPPAIRPASAAGDGPLGGQSFDARPTGAVDGRDESRARFVRAMRDGREVLDGVIRFEIPAGETVQVLHVPVWPPLAAEPAVTCELEEIEGRVRVPVAKTHGFRIEVRVPEAIDEPLAGAVRFVAECPGKSAA